MATMLADGAAKAEIINNNFGLVNPTQTVTFEEHILPDGTALTNQYSSNGVTFTGMWYNSQDLQAYGVPNDGIPNISGHVAENYFPNGQGWYNIPLVPFSINFTSPQNEVAFVLATNSGDYSIITALLGGVVQEIGTFSTSLTNPNDYYGFSGISFDQIQISLPLGNNGAAIIDNIQTASTVPEPSSFALLGLGGIGLALRAYRRRRMVVA